jgi:hypothetical protein
MGEAVFERGPARGFLAAALAVSLLVALDPAPGQANPDGGNDRNEQRDTQSRNEQATLDSIPLRTDTGFFYICSSHRCAERTSRKRTVSAPSIAAPTARWWRWSTMSSRSRTAKSAW